jgi:hypothetical protein
MAEQRITLAHDQVRPHLPKVHEHISRADSDRLDGILKLFESPTQTVANLEKCLDAVSPLKKGDWQKQQADLRQFRQHLKKAFDKCGLGIELMVDTRKRDKAEDRECWFTGPPINRTAERVERFSESAADSDGPEPIEPRGINSDLISRPAARCCILSAEHDAALATKLAELLQREFGAQSEFAYDLWSRDSVIAGENLQRRHRSSANNADIVLTLASPAFLADEELRSLCEESTADSLPVSLKRMADTQDQSCFNDCELFDLQLPESRKSFEQCKAQQQRGQFAQQLFGLIQQRML